jgi:hypothetical protein
MLTTHTCRLAVVSLIAAVLAAAMAAAPAFAAPTSRYAGVGGSAADASCTDPAQPCDLAHLVTTVAETGDDVTVEPGTYTLPSLTVTRGMNIHGQDGRPRPKLLIAGSFGDFPSTGSPVLRYLDLELGYGHLDFGPGTAEQLIVQGGSDTCTLGGAVMFRDNVCTSTNGGNAVLVQTSGDTAHLTLRNVTAIAPSINAAAVRVETLAGGGSLTVDLFNTIAQGGGGTGADLQATTLGSGTATINTNHSEYATAVPSGPGAAINVSVTDQHTAAVFEAGSYREAASSTATIGKGAVEPLNGTFDFEGDLRSINGATDIGADQYVAAPSITSVTGAGIATQATAGAMIDSNGSPTTYSVVYGATSAYGSSTSSDTLPAAAGGQTVAIPLSGLAAGATYHFAIVATNNGGSTTSADQSFTQAVPSAPVPSAPVPPGPVSPVVSASIAPQDTTLAFTHSTFATLRSRSTAIAAPRRRRPFGTRISYSDSQAATTTFTVLRRARGVKSGTRCVAPAQHATNAMLARRCTRYVTKGSFRHVDVAGANHLRFTGWLNRHALKPGHYRITAVPVNAAGQRGHARRHDFTIVR